jgi:hypothetical protein
MACISSPAATRWAAPAAHPRPRDVGIRPHRLPFIQAQRFGANIQQPMMTTPAPRKQPRPVTNPKATASSFGALKSPMSQSIANILGAGTFVPDFVLVYLSIAFVLKWLVASA